MNRFKNNSQFWMQAGKLILVAIAYWVVVRLGLLLVAQPEGVASIWPASGLALAFLLLNPKSQWAKLLAVIFVTNVAGNLSSGNTLPLSLGFALVNTLEAFLGAWALIYFCKSKIAFERTFEIFILFGVAIISNGFTALLGAAVAGLAFGAPFFNTWLVWWTSDGLGMILVAPFIVTLFTGQPMLQSASRWRLVEAVALVIVLSAFAWLLFGPFTVAEEPVLRNYMFFPLLIWLAFRYSPRGMSSALLLLTVIAIWNTLRGDGIFAFANQDVTEHLASLQMLLTVVAFSGLFLSAMLTELKRSGQSLRESEALLSNAFNNSPLLMTISDLSTGKYLEVNDSFCVVSGFSREEAIGRTSIELGWISAEERTRMVSELQRHGKITDLELPLKTKSGRMVICKFMGTIIETGQGSKLFSTAEDITARKQAEEKIQKISRHYQALIENAPDGIVLLNEQGHFKFVSPSAKKMFGFGISDETEGRNPAEYTHPDDLPLVLFELSRMLEDPSYIPILQYRFIDKSGSWKWVESTFTNLLADASVESIVINFRDITERVQADEKLKESEERFSTIFRANPAAVAITRLANSQLVDVNEAWQNITGYTLAEVVGHTAQELNLWASPEQRERLIGMLGEHGKARGEMQLRTKSGDIRYLLMSADLIELRNERYLLTMAQDITELKQTEEQLKETLSLLRIAEESAKLGGWSVDLEKNRCTWSDQVAAIHEMPAGYSPLVEEGINFYAPEWREKIAKVFGDCVQKGIPYNEEMEIVTANGKRVWVQTMGEAVRNEEGRIYKLQGAFQDISERKQTEDALRESEEKFKYLFDNSTVGKSLTLISGEMTVNKALCDMFGYTEAELQNKKWQEITHPEDIELTQREIEKLFSGEQNSARFVKRYIHKNGPVVWVDLSTSLRRDQDGKSLYLMTSVIDITERKRDEDINQRRNQMLLALHNVAMEIGNELQLPILLESILQHAQSMLEADRGGGIYMYDAGENVMRLVQGSGINHGREGITVQIDKGVAGKVFRTLQPLAIDDYTHWEGRADVLVDDPPSTVMGVPLFSNNQIVGVLTLIANSQLRKFNEQDVQIAEMFAAQASIGIRNAQHFQQAQQEISERKQAEKKLRESEQALSSFITNSPDTIYLLNLETHTSRYLNCEEFLGYPRSTLESPASIMFALYSEDRVVVQANWQKMLNSRDNEMISCEYRLQRKDGVWEWIHQRMTILARTADGQPAQVLVTLSIITERKQAEEKIHQLNAELEQRVQERTRELTEAQEKLVRQEKLAVLGQMASSVGHELRNPLAVLNSSVYYLKMIQPDAAPKVREYLEVIEQEVRNSEKIITDLLDFARIKSVDSEAVSVSELIRQTLERFPAPPSVEVILDLPDNLPRVYVDSRQMIQVLGNLTVNACQAMLTAGAKNGGQLTLSTRAQDDMMMITVQDTGIGISPENMKKLFEPLFTTKTKGIGLGLAVSRKLVEANGGRIEVESEVGKGSSFHVYLPIYKESK